jgi:hypothetical protein
MKSIALTRGHETIVDDKDFAWLNQWKWQYGGNGYAVRDQYLGKIGGTYRHKTVLMHREILDAPSGTEVDHANRNKLDNRRDNLRLATRSQNRANIQSARRKNSELPTGITYNPSPRTKQPFMARVAKDGRSYFLGNFYTVDEASQAYKLKKKQLFGEFAG